MSSPEAVRGWAQTTFAALGNRDYRVLWFGTSLAFLAFMMSWVVQSVVAFDLTGKNGAVGAVSLGMGVATLAVAPFGGVIADRVSKRRLLLIGQSAIGLTFASVGVLILTDAITIGWLIASTFVMGVVFSFIAPARQAWIGEILHGPALANGIALQQVAMTGTRILGPLLAAVLIAAPGVGTGGTYLAMAAMFIVVVATLAQLPPTKGRAGVRTSVLADLREGVAHVTSRPRLALLSGMFIAIVITGYSYQVVLPGFLENELGRSSRDLGLLMGVGAVAGLAATLALAGAAGSPRAWELMFAGGLTMGGALAWAGLAPSFLHLAAAMFLVGAGTGTFQMLNNALVMREAEPAYYGRVMSLTMLAWGANGIAGLPFGVLADHVGERATVLGMAAAVIAVTVAAAGAAGTIGRREPALAAVPLSEPREERSL